MWEFANYLEKPMTGMLGVGLGQIKQLYRGRISLHLCRKELSVIIKIPVVKSKSCCEMIQLLVVAGGSHP